MAAQCIDLGPELQISLQLLRAGHRAFEQAHVADPGAATMLGIHRATLRKKLRDYGLA